MALAVSEVLAASVAGSAWATGAAGVSTAAVGAAAEVQQLELRQAIRPEQRVLSVSDRLSGLVSWLPGFGGLGLQELFRRLEPRGKFCGGRFGDLGNRLRLIYSGATAGCSSTESAVISVMPVSSTAED